MLRNRSHFPKILILDLDNTLYNWAEFFTRSIYAMVDEAARVLACDREELLNDLRSVHIEHHDVEYPFSLLETNLVRSKFPDMSYADSKLELDSAFYAFNRMRKRTLHLYPSVASTLQYYTKQAIPIVAHTESNLFAVADRLDRLDVARYFTLIYCRQRPNADHPEGRPRISWRERLGDVAVVELSQHQRKPDPKILSEICEQFNISASDAIYVGDSKTRDILMAKRAGAFSVWAAYGSRDMRKHYEDLVRISHWSEGDIARERALSVEASDIEPDFIARESLSEILELVAPRRSLSDNIVNR